MAINHIYKPTDSARVLHIDGQGSRRLDTKLSDLSGNSNYGIISGAVYKNAPCGQSAVSFDGVNDYVRHDGTPGRKLLLLSSGAKILTSNGLTVFARS
jgi:hypothetical protein